VSKIEIPHPGNAGDLLEPNGRLEAQAILNFRSRESYSDPASNFRVRFFGSGQGEASDGVWVLDIRKWVKTVYLIPDVVVDDDDEIVVLQAGRGGCAGGPGSRRVEFKLERMLRQIVRVSVHVEEPTAGTYLFNVNNVSRCFNLRVVEE
jgi:hypothetical protein